MNGQPDWFYLLLDLLYFVPHGLAWLAAAGAGAWMFRRHRIPGALLLLAGSTGVLRTVLSMVMSVAWQAATTAGTSPDLLMTGATLRTVVSVFAGLATEILLFAAIFGWRGGSSADVVDWDADVPE